MKFLKTKFNGVYYLESKNRKFNNKPDKVYYIRYYIDGIQKQENIGPASRGVTPQYALNIRNERLQAPYVKRDYIFSELYEYYMLWAKANKKTWKSDERRYNSYIGKHLGYIKADEIKTQDINNLLLKIKLNGKKNGGEYAPQTIKHILLLIKRIYNYAISNELVKKNPTNNIKFPKFDNTRIAYLYNDEIERMFTYLDSGKEWEVDISIIKFAFYTGLRRGELFGLEWRNVDIKNKRIMLYNTKGGKNESILITDNAVNVLKNLTQVNEYVFPSKQGGKRNDIKKLWNRIKKEANIRPIIRFHDIRHTFGTLATSVIPVKIVQKMMTHKDIKTTLRYAHIQEKELIDATDTLSDVFSNIGKLKE